MNSIQDQSPCPICGQTAYSWGEVSAKNFDYHSEDDSWLSKSFTLNYKLPARHCDICGNIQLFSQRIDSEDMAE